MINNETPQAPHGAEVPHAEVPQVHDGAPGTPAGDPPYTTQIPRLSDLGKERSKRKKAERQSRYIQEQTHAGEASRYYNSTSWKSLRKIYLMTHPVDELELIKKKVVSAEHVHHLVKWFDQPSEELRWQLLLDEENLISLSSETHQRVHYNYSSLAPEQDAFLRQKKLELALKYAKKGIQIALPEDSNR